MSQRLLQFLAKLSRRGDLVIAIMMMVAIVMMLIPLPTFLVDIMITANIAISVLILLVSFYMVQPLEFSSLPSVILITTLFRLAITITTTRLILLQADAGEIISAFGSFVVGSSIAVGLVIFLIITIAQFIVVAKGAERVAEVAARFTLDAMPGKQMSIDAELRNGDIDQAEARRLRQQLERESQLFGAMDGAMKFVKGDVIAGIIIIMVNLIGGFAVGTLQHGMTMGEAASTYTLLTVGDGLVAQIPALLVAVAAGTMVTRVGSADGQGDLGRQITGQLLRDSRALALAAAIMLGLALVPGFPAIPFIILAVAFGAGAYAIHRQRAADSQEIVLPAAPEKEIMLARANSVADIDALQSSYQLVVRIGSGLAQAISETDFTAQSSRVRRDLYQDLGVDVPTIGFHVDASLEPQRFRMDLEGAPILEADMPADHVLVEDGAENLDLIGVTYLEGAAIAGRTATLWVDQTRTAPLREGGLPYLMAPETAAKWMSHALRIYAGHFVGIQETRRLLSEMEQEYADLVNEVRQAVPLQRIADVLRRLVGENVPVRNLRLILEALIEFGGRETEASLLTEHVRAALKRQISFRAADRNNIISAYVLQRSAEDLLRRRSGSGQAPFNAYDDELQLLVSQIERALGKSAASVLPVVLTAADVRRQMRSLLSHHGLELQVLSYAELAPEFSIQPVATITGDATAGGRPLPAAQDKLAS